MHRRASGTSLFLMEMLVVILFFSLAAAVCMRVFAAAKLASTYSNDLSLASLHAESAAECFKATHGDTAAAADIFGAQGSADGFSVFYGADWNPCGADAAKYTLSLEANGSEARIAVVGSDGAELFAIEAVALLEGGAE